MTSIALTRKRELVWMSPDKIVVNSNNPRSQAAFTPDELVSLRRSIMTHGILEPVIVTPYKGDTYKLIEGERRWTSAKIEGIEEIPAIVVNRMDNTQELVVMFNVHAQRRGWETAEELEAIKRLINDNPDKSDGELAAELGMNTGTFRERRQVLAMGDEVVASIGRGEIDYYAALRTGQVSKTLARQRPELTAKLGGEAEVRDYVLAKARTRKGIVRELENIRQDAKDKAAVPDDVLETYITRKEVTLGEARAQAKSLAERRAVEDVIKQIHHLNSELRVFDVDLYEAPNLSDLRRSLAGLIETAQSLEGADRGRHPDEGRCELNAPACVIDACADPGKHRLGLRCRVMREPTPVPGKPKTYALWSIESNAYLCDTHAMSGLDVTMLNRRTTPGRYQCVP